MVADPQVLDLRMHETAALGAASVPLVIDIDGTLLKTDLLLESYLTPLPLNLEHHRGVALSLLRGKAALKAFLAGSATLDYDTLPTNASVLDLIQGARKAGRPIFLASASDRRHAEEIAARYGPFAGVFSSDGIVNLSGSAKAERLVAAFGRSGFDYVGNSAADLAVWSQARFGYAIATSTRVDRALAGIGIPVEHLPGGPRASPAVWIKAIRVHQWAKNLLVLVPLFTSHSYSLGTVAAAVMAMVAFSTCASGIYIVNDLIDLRADRLHPRKRNRPFASGALTIQQGVAASAVLLGLAAATALSVSLAFAGALLLYFALTNAYSLLLKRKMLVDVVTLALLYTLRVIGGAVAIDVRVSEWLLAFSMFIFLALALIKRYVELRALFEAGQSDPVNRNYRLVDGQIVAALAAASGFNAVTIFSLYAASPDVQSAYRRPELLWLICPLLIYWIARSLMMAHRGAMDDDPLIFALRERVSRTTVLLILLLAGIAAW